MARFIGKTLAYIGSFLKCLKSAYFVYHSKSRNKSSFNHYLFICQKRAHHRISP